MKDKKTIREEILDIRKKLKKEEIKDLSETICDIVQKLKIYKEAEDVCLYMPINNETDVRYLAETARNGGKRVWLPKVIGSEMEFYAYDEGTKLIEGAYNIQEPESDNILKPDETTLVIMPGAAFSEHRDRIGYGGGYYDKYLEKHPKCMTMAVCYSFQIVDELPAEEHDIKPQVIVSEEKILL